MCGLKCNYMYLETGPFLLQYLWMMIIMSRTMGHFLQRCLQKKNANKFNFFLCRAETSATNSVHWRRAFWLGNASSRPDTARRQHWQLPPCPLVIALATLKCSNRIVRFPQRCPLPMRKFLGAIVLSKTKHTGLVFSLLTRFESSDEIWVARSITPWVSLEWSPF